MEVNVEYVVIPGRTPTPSRMRLVDTLEIELSQELMLKVKKKLLIFIIFRVS